MAKTGTSGTGSLDPAGGFTLLELIVVLAICGLIAAIAIPALSGGHAGAGLKAASAAVAGGLRQARTDAIFASREVAFIVDVDGRALAVEGRTAQPIADSIDITFRSAESEVRSPSRGAIRFYPDGSSTGGWVSLAPSAGGGQATRIAVDWLTGRVIVTEN